MIPTTRGGADDWPSNPLFFLIISSRLAFLFCCWWFLRSALLEATMPATPPFFPPATLPPALRVKLRFEAFERLFFLLLCRNPPDRWWWPGMVNKYSYLSYFQTADQPVELKLISTEQKQRKKMWDKTVKLEIFGGHEWTGKMMYACKFYSVSTYVFVRTYVHNRTPFLPHNRGTHVTCVLSVWTIPTINSKWDMNESQKSIQSRINI